MNRILAACERMEKRLLTQSAETLTRLNDGMDIDSIERSAWQSKQSAAFASGKLTLEEAELVYRWIGETGHSANGGWPVETTLAQKVVVTSLMGELFGVKTA